MTVVDLEDPMTHRIPMTVRGWNMLRKELQRLKKEERPKIVEEIARAREHGDLSENAEYDAAKERQGFIEARIREIEEKTALAEVIDPSKLKGEKVVFGATVTLEDNDSSDEVVYQIVGDDEANVEDGKISISSPIARALIGRNLDDEVKVQTPGGTRVFEIVDVSFV